MTEKFDEEESIILAMYRGGSRGQVMEKLKAVLPYLVGDEEMRVTVGGILRKLERVTDDAFKNLDSDKYGVEMGENVGWE